MAGTVQRLIRHVWGFISSPANIENKQQSFNEGDNGSGRDRTQLVAKGPTGTLHTFITIDEVEDYVNSQIGNSSLIDSVFVKVRDEAEFSIAISSELPMSIYCDDGNGKGIETTSESLVVLAKGKKTIYGAGGVCLNIKDPTNQIGFIFLDGVSDVRFIDNIFLNGSSVTSLDITGEIYGGSGSKLFFSSIVDKYNETGVKPSYTSFSMNTIYAPDLEMVYERNSTDYSLSSEAGLKNYLWSGKSENLYTDRKTCISDLNDLTSMIHDESGDLGSKVVETLTDTTSTNVAHKKDYSRTTLGGSTYEVFAREEINSGDKTSSEPSSYILSLWAGVYSTLTPSIKLGYRLISTEPSLTYPWSKTKYSVIQSGLTFIFAQLTASATDINGIAYYCYNDGTNWRYTTTNKHARLEILANDKKTEYKSQTAGTQGDVITWVAVDDFHIETKELSSVTASAGEITGLRLTPASDGLYQIDFKCNVTMTKISGLDDHYVKINILKDTTVIDYVIGSFTIDTGNGSSRVTLNSNFIAQLTSVTNVKFEIETVTGSPSISIAKSSIQQIRKDN